jgi:membrane fusion protein (multidrug efflux system)
MKKIFISFCAAAVAMVSCQQHPHENHQEPVFMVSKPVRQDTTIYNEYVCQIRSIQHIELRALERGYLQHIYVDEGQTVKKGQLLFKLLPVIYEAETQRAKAEVNFVEIEYKNTKALADSGIVSKNELALAKAKLEKVKAELALAQAHLSFTEIRAPFDGIVGRFNDVRLGSLLEEGELITTLSDNNKMWVYFNVPESEYLDYVMHHRTDSALRVKLELANGKMFPQDGIVETIESDFNNETGNIAFRATFKNPNKVLRNGETGNIFMAVQLNKVLLIPQKATFEILDKKYVYVVKNDTVKSKEIKVATEIPHLYAVSHGLTEQDTILVEGIRKVKNNQHIKYQFESLTQILRELQQLHAE